MRASIFEAYVGAIFSESGLDSVSHWLKLLIRRVLEQDDIAQMTPRGEDSPLPAIGDLGRGTDDMHEQILVRERLDNMSIAGSDSTAVGTGTGGYGHPMNQFSNRPIAPSTFDGSFTPRTASTGFLAIANDQPLAVATATRGRPSPLRNEIRDYLPGRYSPNVTGHHSPSQLPFAPNPQYSPDINTSVPSYTQQQYGESPPPPGGNGSFRSSSSSSTVRPPVKTPHGSPSSNAGVSSTRSSPSVTSSGSSDSTGSGSGSAQSQTSTRSVAGGHLALFNQMATQKKEQVEWKMASSGPPHKPKFDAQVFSTFWFVV